MNDSQAAGESALSAVDIIKTFRKNIDAQIVYAESLMGTNSAVGYPVPQVDITAHAMRELSLVRTKLQEAKMWAGKMLEAIGTPFPAELADKANVQ